MMRKTLLQQYNQKVPEDVLESIEKASILADNHLGKDYIPKADIHSMKLISRVTFDMDTIE